MYPKNFVDFLRMQYGSALKNTAEIQRRFCDRLLDMIYFNLRVSRESISGYSPVVEEYLRLFWRGNENLQKILQKYIDVNLQYLNSMLELPKTFYPHYSEDEKKIENMVREIMEKVEKCKK